jgi:DNA-binding transcriptional LysR family regulator
MFDLADLRFIQALAGSPTFAAAARSLGVTPPAMTQRLAQMESRLKILLVERGLRGVRLTLEGELMARRAEGILEDLSTLATELSGLHEGTSGPLRVVAPLVLGRSIIGSLIGSFVLEHRDVKPQLVLSSDPRGTARSSSWDVLIQMGRPSDTDVRYRVLAQNRRLLCASPAYLEQAGVPVTAKDLRQHSCGALREDQGDPTVWKMSGPAEAREAIRINAPFACNDSGVLRQWALSGMGIVEQPEWAVREDLLSGGLVQVLPDWSLSDGDIVALANPGSLRVGLMQAFIDHLAASGWQRRPVVRETLDNEKFTLNEASFILGCTLAKIHKAIDSGILEVTVRGARGASERMLGLTAMRYLLATENWEKDLTLNGQRRIYTALRECEPTETRLEIGNLMLDLSQIDGELAVRSRPLQAVREFILDDDKNRQPTIRGTKIGIQVIAGLVKGQKLDDIIELVPSLRREQIEAAIAYAKLYPRRLVMDPDVSVREIRAALIASAKESPEGT